MGDLTKKVLRAEEQGTSGKWLVDAERLKTVASLVISIGAVLLYITNTITAVTSAPKQIEDVRREVVLLHSYDAGVDKRLAVQEQNLCSITQALADIRNDIRDLRADIRVGKR